MKAALKGRGFQPRRRGRLKIGALAPADKRVAIFVSNTTGCRQAAPPSG